MSSGRTTSFVELGESAPLANAECRWPTSRIAGRTRSGDGVWQHFHGTRRPQFGGLEAIRDARGQRSNRRTVTRPGVRGVVDGRRILATLVIRVQEAPWGMCFMHAPAISLLLLGTLCAVSLAQAGQAPSGGTPLNGQVEEIYIARSMFESGGAPTEFCAATRTGFTAMFEARYTFRSTDVRADGRIVNANVATIGRLHACVGSAPDGTTDKFYAEGALGSLPLTAVGECRLLKQNFPESGIDVATCAFDLRDLPSTYVGGQLTSNTVSSRQDGAQSDPPGYTQPSIATIRLWRRR